MTMPIYRYQLVEFNDDATESGSKVIDCVPMNWIKYDVTLGQCSAKFMPPPYTKEKSKILDKMVREDQDPIDDWPRYSINIRGRAETYDEAMRRLERLRTEEYAYTTECENPNEKVQESIQSYVDEARKDNSKLQKIMEVPNFDTPIHESDISSADYATYNPSLNGSSTSSVGSIDENENRTKKRHCQKSKKAASKIKRGSRKPSTLTTKRKNKVQGSGTIITPIQLSTSPNDSQILKTKRVFVEKTSCNTNAPSKRCTGIRAPRFDSTTQARLSRASESPPAISHALLSPYSPVASKKVTSRSTETPTPHIVESLSETFDFKLVVKEIRQLAYDNRQQTAVIKEMKRILDDALAAQVLRPSCESFEKKYKLDLPLATLEDFSAFDNRLSIDEGFRTGFLNSLTQKFDERKTITKNITTILKKYLAREVAFLYTAQKRIAGKFVFKETKFCRVLHDGIDALVESKTIVPVTDAEYLGHLGAVLSNVKDWGVPRLHRHARGQKADPQTSDKHIDVREIVTPSP